MQFSKLKNKHLGSTIGVLGSGPSLNLNKDRLNSLCDIVISSNGSINSLNTNTTNIDYFLSADEFSPTRDWYNKASEFKSSSNKKVIRISPHFLMPFEKDNLKLKKHFKEFMLDKIGGLGNHSEILNQYLDFLSTSNYTKESEKLERVIRAFFNSEDGKFKSMLYDYKIPNSFKTDSIPISLCGFYSEFGQGKPIKSILENFNLDDGNFFMNGTISAIGTQVAKQFGASRINLFGCDFSNSSGSNYAKGNNPIYFGNTSNRCRDVFDAYISSLQNKGIEVFHYGETTLKNPIIIK